MFELHPGEMLLKEGNMTAYALTSRRGTGYLTSQRIVHYGKSTLLTSQFGLIGALIFAFLPNKLTLDLSLNSIKSFKTSSFLKIKTLTIFTEDDKKYNLTMSDFDNWFAAIRQTLENSSRAQVVQTGDDKFDVHK